MARRPNIAARDGDDVENIAAYPRNQPATRNSVSEKRRATREARCRITITPPSVTSATHITTHGTAASRIWKGTGALYVSSRPQPISHAHRVIASIVTS